MNNESVKRFSTIPKINLQDLADYFNLEYGLTLFDGDEEDEYLVDRINEEQFTPEHFSYLGVYEIDGIETMFWSVEGEDVCATVEPYEDSICIGMNKLPFDETKA